MTSASEATTVSAPVGEHGASVATQPAPQAGVGERVRGYARASRRPV